MALSGINKKPCALSLLLCVCLALAAVWTAPFPARAASAPVGFLPGPGKNDMTWAQGNAFCRGKQGGLPTEAQLKAIAKGSGDGSFAAFDLSDGFYWSRDGMDQKRITVSLADGLSVPATVTSRRPVICGYGIARPRTAKGIPPGFATELSLTTLFWADAERFCKSRGKRLPDAEALRRIADKAGKGGYAEHGWPPSPFWTREGANGRHTAVSLGDGTAMPFKDGDKQWAACVD